MGDHSVTQEKHLADIAQTLGRMEAQMGNMHSLLEKHIEKDEDTFEKHDTRLRKVEQRQSWFLGIGAAIAFAASYLMDIFKGN